MPRNCEEEFRVLEVSLMVLLFFWKIVFKCSLKFNLLFKYIPKSFWREVCWTTFWLKNKGGWFIVCTSREKISSCACLVGSGLMFIFHWNAHSPIFIFSLFFLSKFLLMDKVIKSKRWLELVTSALQVTKQVQKNPFFSYILCDQVWWCNIKRFLNYFRNYICKFMPVISEHY